MQPVSTTYDVLARQDGKWEYGMKPVREKKMPKRRKCLREEQMAKQAQNKEDDAAHVKKEDVAKEVCAEHVEKEDDAE